PQLAPLGVHDRPRQKAGREPLLEQAAVAALADEADLLALRLVGGRQAECAGPLPDLRLEHPAHREPDGAELALPQLVEDVGLVLALVHGLAQDVLALARLDPSVVPGRQRPGPQR